MDEKTLKALKASIQHWKENEEGPFEQASTNAKACALCELFLYSSDCGGCPVFEETGQKYCKDTPYTRADLLLASGRFAEQEDRFRETAKAEREFLESLLPKEPQP